MWGGHVGLLTLFARETTSINIDARHQLDGLVAPEVTLPEWRIDPPAPADELLGYYRKAESETGVGWNYLAAKLHRIPLRSHCPAELRGYVATSPIPVADYLATHPQ